VAAVPSERPQKVVETDRGRVLGVYEDDVAVFHSIPFAAPPTGELRFRAPRDVQAWNGTRDARGLKHICPQLSLARGTPLHLGDEDCLYMHVYAPKQRQEDELLPVMFWIYGGFFTMGDGFEFGAYDGKELAQRHRVIVVSPNYRVGVLGFLAQEALRQEDEHGSLGNMGIQDQRMALQFFRRNAKAFGGDPRKITIFGESAGAFSVCHHVSNGFYTGLFHRAIMESGSCDAPEFFLEPAKAINLGNLLVEGVGCEKDDLQCLRELETSELLYGLLPSLAARPETVDSPGIPTLTPLAPFGPVVDGTKQGLPMLPLEAVEAGEHVKVPVLLGTNQNEGSIMVPLVRAVVPGLPVPVDESTVQQVLHHVLDPVVGKRGAPADINPVLCEYPSEEFRNEEERLSMLIRDYFFVCPARRAARAVSNYDDVFLYHFTYPEHWIESKVFHDYHFSEVTFVFGNEDPFFWHRWTEDDYAMRHIFQEFWTTFSRTGTPNQPGTPNRPGTSLLAMGAGAPAPSWPPFATAEGGGGVNAFLDVNVTIGFGFSKAHCDFFDAYLGFTSPEQKSFRSSEPARMVGR